MFLYLVQHAEAKTEQEDPSRPLSEKGVKDITKVALHLSKLDFKISRVLHSKKLRAKQTADILAEYVKPSGATAESDGLAPMDDPSAWADRLKYLTASVTENIVLVGHLPHLGKLASLLLCGDADRNVVSFRMGCVTCLERDEKGNWTLQWMITPGVVV
ncbi:MAG: phosphohistidine phosphatase SixA [Candidatus Sulfobium sp.]|jgi:phosphohistidine phosphatase